MSIAGALRLQGAAPVTHGCVFGMLALESEAIDPRL